VFLGDQLPGGLDWPGVFEGRLLDQTACPVLSFVATDWEPFLAGRSANFRQQIRRLERRVLGDGGMSICGTDAERLESDLDALFSLHRLRFGRSSRFVASEPFHRAFARVAFERGWLRLRLLEERGIPVAAWYGLEFAGVCSYYQAGRGPRTPRTPRGRCSSPTPYGRRSMTACASAASCSAARATSTAGRTTTKASRRLRRR
jgi:hypothetical protein